MSDDPITERIEAGLARFERIRPAVEAGAPWPLAERFDDAPEAHWGPPEVLAHVAEMLGYWRTQLERLVAGAGEPVPFGRTGADTDRLSTIEHDRNLPPAELFSKVRDGAGRFVAAWTAWTPADRERVGVHPRLGEMTVAASAERFVAGHLLAHADQLETTVGVAPPGA
jgi:hypothetical protein